MWHSAAIIAARLTYYEFEGGVVFIGMNTSQLKARDFKLINTLPL